MRAKFQLWLHSIEPLSVFHLPEENWNQWPKQRFAFIFLFFGHLALKLQRQLFAANTACGFVLSILALRTIILTHLLGWFGALGGGRIFFFYIIRIDLVTSLPKPPIWRKSPSNPSPRSAWLPLCARQRFLWQPCTFALICECGFFFYQTSISSLTRIQRGVS